MAESISDIRGQKIKELVKEMQLYNNPQEIEEMRKVIKKNVPLLMRGNLLAYLYITRHGSTSEQTRPSRAQKAPVRSLENTVAFYISVGKNSKSSPKELAEFICQKANIANDAIVAIAYKQNYSFIHIKKEASEGIIEAINGQLYKGRKVKMNYSKEKDAE
jgi:hypothetical protein